jgi:hypothetical protein
MFLKFYQQLTGEEASIWVLLLELGKTASSINITP